MSTSPSDAGGREPSGLTLCTLNVNGIRAAERRGFSRWLRRRRPDVLCLQELRAGPDQVPRRLVSPRGYATRWITAERPGYAGVGVYSRDAPRGYATGTGLDWGDREGRALRADLDGLSVVSLYVPSGSSSERRQAAKLAYLDHLADWCQDLLREDAPIALCGDFNVAHTELDIHDPRGNARSSGFLPVERAWFTRLLAQGWVDVLREHHQHASGLYSWWSNRGRARELDRGWRIDYVLASPRLAARVEDAWIEKRAGLSDHAPVWVRFRNWLG